MASSIKRAISLRDYCHFITTVVVWLISFLISNSITAQDEKVIPPGELKKMSFEELMNIKVTSVSKRPERLLETASAIQVITGDAINGYGATTIPDALYLAGNLQVAQRGTNSWGISARGFNTELANKMLVLFDGRAIYTPLYSGVFWDRHDYILEDINRIEVISGPGGTLWGANAVNGVINITTKSADKTQGLLVHGQAGNELKSLFGIRYGGKIAPNTYYRVYGRYSSRDDFIYPDSVEAKNPWLMGQGGFRIDANSGSNSKYTFQGDFYVNNAEMPKGGITEVIGGNILGRWTYNFADSSNLRIQAYYDKTIFNLPTSASESGGVFTVPAGTFGDKLSTYDIDLQYHFEIGSFNHLVTGAGYRLTYDQVSNSPGIGFLPEVLKQNLFSIFLQDEIKVFRNLFVTLGSKLEHNDYTGYVLEPNGRIRYNIRDKWMVWSAISIAVRTPSRIDRDVTRSTPPYFVIFEGNPDFKSETLTSQEFGLRGEIGDRATTSVSLFYNYYDNLRSTVADPVTIFPFTFENGLEGEVYGYELSLNYLVFNWWQITASCNRLREDIRVKEGATDFNNAHNETADPEWQFSVRSSLKLPYRISANFAFRWIDELPINDIGDLEIVPSYYELDGQISWRVNKNIEVSLAGRNLLHKYHVEYGRKGSTQQGIERSVYGKLVLKF